MNDYLRDNVGKRLISTKSIFSISIIIAVLTVIVIWLGGLGQNRSLFENSILSTSVLSLAFFLFIVTGLYKGIKLKDNIGNITDKIKIGEIPDVFTGIEIPTDAPELDDNIGGIIIGIIVWILFSILLLVLIWIFGAVFWVLILVFIAMLYWIFFRALRLVFKNSNKCKGSLIRSIIYGLGYTLLYNFWIYSLIYIMHYL